VIRQVDSAHPAPERERDFDVEGNWEDVLRECDLDSRETGHGLYLVDSSGERSGESADSSLWHVWRVEGYRLYKEKGAKP
jgi:hypothetical protein